MGIVKLAALRSKDPSTQVGAIIVNDKKQILASGYNGFPRGLDDNVYS
jgi:dCMP deaminase